MGQENRMFVVMKMQKFEFESASNYFPFAVKIDTGKMIGYLPVYKTKEEALASCL